MSNIHVNIHVKSLLVFSCLVIRLPFMKEFPSDDQFFQQFEQLQLSHFLNSHHDLPWWDFAKHLNELLCSSGNSEISYFFVKAPFIFGMTFTFPNLTDTAIVSLGTHCCATLAQMLLRVLCFKEFPLAVSFQHNFAFNYCSMTKSKIFFYRGTRSMYFDTFTG